jgi:hypothetical protein
MSSSTPSVDEYVRDNREDLIWILRHGDDLTIRALALAVLLQGGDDPDVDLVIEELERER